MAINEKDFLTLKSGAVTCTKQESAGMKVMWSEDACGWGDKGGVSVRGGWGWFDECNTMQQVLVPVKRCTLPSPCFERNMQSV